MYYKKQEDIPPVIKVGCVYAESYFYDGYLYLKYAENNIPSEILTEITQEEYEVNKPVVPDSEPQELPLSGTEQAILQTAITTEYMAALMEISR